MSPGSIDYLLKSARYAQWNEFIKIVQEELEIASPTTGHGKVQRAFARKILDRIGDMK